MTRARFEQLVEEALRGIPRRFRDAMKNVAVIVEDEPPPHVLEDMDMGPEDELFGLYEGTPLPERGASYGNVLPDRISIYQLAIERACLEEARTARGAGGSASERRGAGRGAPATNDDESIRICIAETVIHEFGHYFGMTEEEIEEIEENYWRGRAKE
jgi:predicted Zn-dependent protease with MMP-like domain